MVRGAAIARGIDELTVGDLQRHTGETAGDYPQFVVGKTTGMDGQMSLLEANPGPLAIGRPRTAKLDVLDAHIPAPDHPDRLVVAALTITEHHRPLAGTANDQIVLRPQRRLTTVTAGTNLDHLAIPGQPCRLGQRPDLLAGPDHHRRFGHPDR